MSEVRWHPGAVLDAESARDWYAEQSPFAARGFLLGLEAALQAVADSPLAAPEKSRGCRHYVFPSGYPFTLVYRIGETIEIVAVATPEEKARVLAQPLETRSAYNKSLERTREG